MLCPKCGQEIGNEVKLCPGCSDATFAHTSLTQSRPLPTRMLAWLALGMLSLALVLLLWGFGGWQLSERRHPPGQLAPHPPQQHEANSKVQLAKHGYHIKSLASFQMKARVLLTSRYYFSAGSDLSPIDITFGWGPLSDQAILDQISLSNGYRDYRWWSSNRPPLSHPEMNRHMANMHLIPANDEVLAMLKRAIPGDVAELRGHLVSVTRPDGFHWKSSLTREDSGGGACELVWVDSFSILP